MSIGELKQEASREHHPEYRRGVQDAIIALLKAQNEVKPEYLAEAIVKELL